MRDMILAKEVQLVEEAEVGVMSKECVNMINSVIYINEEDIALRKCVNWRINFDYGCNFLATED